MLAKFMQKFPKLLSLCPGPHIVDHLISVRFSDASIKQVKWLVCEKGSTFSTYFLY